MSLADTIFLFVLALVLFGPKKLPEIARTIGKYMNEFKRASNEFRAQIEQEISNLEVEKRQTILPPVPPPAGSTSRAPALAAGEGSTTGTSAGAVVNEPPATPEPSDDEPLFAAQADSPAVEAAASRSQESHV